MRVAASLARHAWAGEQVIEIAQLAVVSVCGGSEHGCVPAMISVMFRCEVSATRA